MHRAKTKIGLLKLAVTIQELKQIWAYEKIFAII